MSEVKLLEIRDKDGRITAEIELITHSDVENILRIYDETMKEDSACLTIIHAGYTTEINLRELLRIKGQENYSRVVSLLLREGGIE